MNHKILHIEEAKKISNDLKKKNKRVILCHGAFDLLHTGHFKHLKSAKSQADILFVSITSDKYILKGPGRPVFNEKLRSENLAAIEYVDYVFINESETAIKSIEAIKPNLYAKGSDYKNLSDDVTGNIEKEIFEVKRYNGEIFYTDEITYSSSSLINEFFSSFSDEVKDFLNFVKSRFTENDLFKKIDDLSSLKVLVIGDAIIDEYVYVDPLGQTGKSNILAVNKLYTEKYAGGSLAVANHISNFTKSVDLVCGVGKEDSGQKFLLNHANKNVICNFYPTSQLTLTKKRYIDGDLNKFFEVYEIGKKIDNNDSYKKLVDFIIKNIKKYDLVVVPDFGNGFITNQISEIIEKYSKFLAVNTQINSGNRGYHVIGKYKKANFISINEPEARLATHNKVDPIESVAHYIKKQITKSDNISITLGKRGVFSLSKKNDSFSIPALSFNVIDRIGAGDAYLSIASIGLASGMTLLESSFIGSVAAALDVQIICNKESISKVKLKKYISTLLK